MPHRRQSSIAALCAGVYFTTAGGLITGSRSSLTAAYADLLMFLNGNQDHIPIEVPVT